MNWDIIIPAVLVALPATVFSAAALVQAFKTHTAVNHRMDELLALAKSEAALFATATEKKAQHIREGEAAIVAESKKDS